MRIGIFGGTFNPIHQGHLLMAELACGQMRLDKVIFVPANCSPFKVRNSSKAKDRLAMVRLAIKGNPSFEASDLELKRPAPSYAIDTLRLFKDKYRKARLFWIIGEDNIAGLTQWKEFGEIVKIAAFVAVSRSFFNISSTEIRQRVKNGKSIRYLTPEPVIRYINRHKLYRN